MTTSCFRCCQCRLWCLLQAHPYLWCPGRGSLWTRSDKYLADGPIQGPVKFNSNTQPHVILFWTDKHPLKKFFFLYFSTGLVTVSWKCRTQNPLGKWPDLSLVLWGSMTVICRQIVAIFIFPKLVRTVCMQNSISDSTFFCKVCSSERVAGRFASCLEAFEHFTGTPNETKWLLRPRLKGENFPKCREMGQRQWLAFSNLLSFSLFPWKRKNRCNIYEAQCTINNRLTWKT